MIKQQLQFLVVFQLPFLIYLLIKRWNVFMIKKKEWKQRKTGGQNYERKRKRERAFDVFSHSKWIGKIISSTLNTTQATHSHNSRVVDVNDALDVRPGSMDGRVEHEASHIDAKVGGSTLDHVALHVHLDEGGSRDLVVQHAEGVEQKVFHVLADAGLYGGRGGKKKREKH